MANDKKTATQRPTHRRGMSAGDIRDERRKRSQRRKNLRKAVITGIAFSAAIVLVLAFVIPVIFSVSPNRSNHLGFNAGGSVTPADPDNGSSIVINNPTAGQTDTVNHTISTVSYTTTPATSGPRYFSSNVILPGGQQVMAPADWGKYDFALPDEVLVSNLVYGGIGLHYDCPVGNECPDLVNQLDGIRPLGSILSPYPGLQSKENFRIVITGWRHRLYLNQFDEQAIQTFINDYRNRGVFPVFSNNPAIFGHQQQ